MLQGFAQTHPSSWTAEDLEDADVDLSTNRSPTSSQVDARRQAQHAPRSFVPLRARPAYQEEKEAEDEDNLSISLDFLHQSEEENLVRSRRGRSGAKEDRRLKGFQRSLGDSEFAYSSDLESPAGSETGWRRSLVTESDPIHKTVPRSGSRDPPGSTRLASNGSRSHSLFPTLSPHLDSSSPSSLSSFGGRVDCSVDTSHSTQHSVSLGRSASASRAQQSQIHLPPWAVDSGTLLRQSGEYKGNGHQLKHSKSDWNTSIAWNSSNAGVTGGSPRDPQRPPPVLQRSMPANTANAMATTGSHSPDLNRGGLGSPHLGLATMPEEAGDAIEAGNQHQSMNRGEIRSSARHRSTSSAAALQHADSASSQRGNSADSFSRSISLWRGEFGGANGGWEMGPGSYAQAAQPPQSSPTRFSHSSQLETGRFVSSHFHSYVEEEDGMREPMGGESESRRHSIAADYPSSAAVPLGQRRAIGFEVSLPHPTTTRTTSAGRNQTSAIPRGGFSSGSNLFGGGGLAISEDDLAVDVQNLHINLEDVIHRQQQEERWRTNMRVPSSNAAASGAHPASMPPGYGIQGQGGGFGLSPPIGSRLGKWPVSARFLDDDTSSTWSDTIPSPSANSVFQDHNQAYQQQQQQQQQQHGEGTFADDRKTNLSATAKAFHGSGGNAFVPHHAPPLYPSGNVPTSYPARRPSQDKGSDYVSSSPTMPFQPFAPPHQQPPAAPAKSSTATLSELAIASLVTLGPLAPASGGPNDGPSSLQELGKGVPLQMLPRQTTLYIVEFKEGRTDLYFRQQQGPNRASEDIQKGDLVIVEADRGKDLGTVINDTITVDQVQSFLAHQAELTQSNATQGNVSSGGPDAPHPATVSLSRLTRSINPKRLFSKAGPADTSLLHSKAQDEERALTLCTTKVNQRGLPMTVLAAEMQWDRRKLTFYYTATQRVDFRDLVKELFRLYKTRIWMCHLSHPSGTGIST